MYIIHEHCNSTSAIDKYWIFKTESDAQTFYTNKVIEFYDYIDRDFYKELYENTYDDDEQKINSFDAFFEEQINTFDCLNLIDNDYIVYSELCEDEEGILCGRKP